MESPFDRPVAANLIRRALEEHADAMSRGVIGASREMAIYAALKDAGYLTDEAMKAEGEPE